jgi:hypothetical protein
MHVAAHEGRQRMSRARKLWYEFRRLSWALGIALGGIALLSQLSEQSKIALVVYKACLISVFWVVWRLLLDQTFDYLHFKTCLEQGGLRALAAAIVIAGTCLAVVLGAMLGL